MPLNASPPTLDAASFEAKVTAAQGCIHVDAALWGGLVPGPLDRLDELASCGVVGFKAFMSDSGIGDFARVDDDALGEGMRRAAARPESSRPPRAAPARRGLVPGCQRGRSRPRSTPSAAPSRSPPRPAARCTSSTSPRRRA
jgi:dihydroorotase-like cyclic amidohydrolase